VGRPDHAALCARARAGVWQQGERALSPLSLCRARCDPLLGWRRQELMGCARSRLAASDLCGMWSCVVLLGDVVVCREERGEKRALEELVLSPSPRPPHQTQKRNATLSPALSLSPLSSQPHRLSTTGPSKQRALQLPPRARERDEAKGAVCPPDTSSRRARAPLLAARGPRRGAPADKAQTTATAAMAIRDPRV
jgi:hypothetical protein